jgi:hypothetical protein
LTTMINGAGRKSVRCATGSGGEAEAASMPID